MSEAERGAQHEHADRRTAEVLLEAAEQERALQFLADASGEQSRSSRASPLPADRPAASCSIGFAVHVVKAGQQSEQPVQQESDHQEDERDKGQAEREPRGGRSIVRATTRGSRRGRASVPPSARSAARVGQRQREPNGSDNAPLAVVGSVPSGGEQLAEQS